MRSVWESRDGGVWSTGARFPWPIGSEGWEYYISSEDSLAPAEDARGRSGARIDHSSEGCSSVGKGGGCKSCSSRLSQDASRSCACGCGYTQVISGLDRDAQLMIHVLARRCIRRGDRSTNGSRRCGASTSGTSAPLVGYNRSTATPTSGSCYCLSISEWGSVGQGRNGCIRGLSCGCTSYTSRTCRICSHHRGAQLMSHISRG